MDTCKVIGVGRGSNPALDLHDWIISLETRYTGWLGIARGIITKYSE
jgi:hypothetical protein